MHAVVEINGRQYQVEEGRYVKVDKLSEAENDVLELGNVLMLVDGKTSLVGAPFVDGAKVTAKVVRHGRDGKVIVYKMRCKKGYRRKNGHRQGFTHLQIESVDFPGRTSEITKPAEKKARPEKPKAEPKAEKAPAKAAKPAAKAPAEKPAKEAEPKAEKAPAAKKPAADKAPTEKKPAAKKPAAKKKSEE